MTPGSRKEQESISDFQEEMMQFLANQHQPHTEQNIVLKPSNPNMQTTGHSINY